MHNIYVISDIDECANPRDVCPYLTECINTVGSYICDCKEAGFKADGKQCLGKPSIGKMLKQQHILVLVNLYLIRVIPSEYLKVYLLSIGV